jgi:hypothetical protein
MVREVLPPDKKAEGSSHHRTEHLELRDLKFYLVGIRKKMVVTRPPKY